MKAIEYISDQIEDLNDQEDREAETERINGLIKMAEACGLVGELPAEELRRNIERRYELLDAENSALWQETVAQSVDAFDPEKLSPAARRAWDRHLQAGWKANEWVKQVHRSHRLAQEWQEKAKRASLDNQMAYCGQLAVMLRCGNPGEVVKRWAKGVMGEEG